MHTFVYMGNTRKIRGMHKLASIKKNKMRTINDAINELTQNMSDFGQGLAINLSKEIMKFNGSAFDFKFNMNKEVNASVTPVMLKTGSLGYAISMNRGLVFNIYILASALLSKSDVMPDLGENEIEFAEGKVNLTEIEWGNDLDLQINELTNENIILYRLSHQRSIALHNIVWGAFLFAYFHELGHAQRTHCSWYYSICQDALREDRDTNFLKSISSQALELSADAHASLEIAKFINNFKQKEELVRFYGFGIGLLFETFDTVFTPLKNYEESSHPHPGIRFLYTSRGFAGRALKYGVNLPDDVQKSFEKGFIEAANACMLIDAETAISDIASSKTNLDKTYSKMESILDELDRISVEYIPKWSW